MIVTTLDDLSSQLISPLPSTNLQWQIVVPMLFRMSILFYSQKIFKSAIVEFTLSLLSLSLLHYLCSSAGQHSYKMNEPPCLLLENLLRVGQNPPGKPTDEGGNAGIKEIRENGVKVRFTIDNRMRTVSPQWILRSALVHTYARQQNCDGCPHPSQLSVNHAIKRREFNANSENRETHKQFDLSSKSFGIEFTTSYLSLGVGIFWFFFAIYCLLTQHHMLTSHEFWMIISSAQFVTRSVVGLHCPFILMSIKKPHGLLYSVL